MNLIEQHDVLDQAAIEICRIIKAVEDKTGGKIKGFSIDRIDVTNIDNDEPKYLLLPRFDYTPPAETMKRLKEGGVFEDKKPWWGRLI